MANHKSIIVLTPNGRRQTVKVTPNTTLLQVLEQASSKHDFNPHEYDLRHHNKIMDLDNAIRFTGLPNNALLEMVPTTTTRKDSEVILGVQIETGERITGSFMPSDSLLSVLNKLCPGELSKEGNPVVIYMRTEVSGISLLESTNLRFLGITGGRAMLRFVHRSPEVLRTQANVSAPLPRPASKHNVEPEIEKRSVDSGSLDKHNDSKEVNPKKKLSNEVKAESVAKEILPAKKEPTEEIQKERIQEVEPMDEEATKPEEEKMDKEVVPESSQSVRSKLDTTAADEEEPMDTTDSKKKVDQVMSVSTQKTSPVQEEIKLLPGDRSGCVYSMNQPVSSSAKGLNQDLPDEFFQVTLEDARILLRDLKKRRAELEDAPLLTSAARYRNNSPYIVMPCVIRVMFPNRIVLQGCFVGGETVEDIKSFVKENLEEPSHPFHLYLAPPKVVLKPESRLYCIDGFPAALLYFSYDKDDSSQDDSSAPPKSQYLQSSVITNLTSQACANRVACKARGLYYSSQGSTSCSSSDADAILDTSSQPSTSRKSLDREYSPRGSDSSPKPATQATPASSEKVPKWFRSSK